MTKLLSVDLRRDIPAPDAAPDLGDLHRLFDIGSVRVNSGSRFDSRWGDVRIEVRDDKERPPGLTDFFQTVPFAVISKSFAKLLERFGCAAELLPLQVRYRRKWMIGDYFALNVLAVVDDAVDRGRSKFASYDAGPLEEVEHLELNDAVLAAHPVAYLREVCCLAVSDTLAAEILAAGLRGVKLSSPQEFRS
ncbi:hypothetical protein [uncultured Pseudacidovorax sp.]|uniref:hypothetical protein n=1 Tax=uncultured Pseudacidovorax sp. TaxID=679313 RepID=UPI0025D7F8F7|nr:hypothetical protein [uncultured Pseudacidovorax sp.]